MKSPEPIRSTAIDGRSAAWRVTRGDVMAWACLAVVLLLAALELRLQGRLWWCKCGRLLFWIGGAQTPETSQHLADPYTLSHVLHGFIFYWLIVWLLPRLSFAWRLLLATVIEVLWELVENTDFVIRRYREATAALGYEGDTVVNSLGDILACAIGVVLAQYLGPRRTIIAYVLIELFMLVWIRDNLTLNVLMLFYPIEAIKTWQTGS